MHIGTALGSSLFAMNQKFPAESKNFSYFLIYLHMQDLLIKSLVNGIFGEVPLKAIIFTQF